MSVKLQTEASVDRETASDFSCPINDFSSIPNPQRALLEFVLAHSDTDERPYLNVTVFGTVMLGLLDSGATHTVVGEAGYQTLLRLGCSLVSDPISNCRVADGSSCSVTGVMNVPFELEGRLRLLKVLVVPSLPHTLILGADFWKAMGVVPDLRRGAWQFSGTPEIAGVQACESGTGTIYILMNCIMLLPK